MRQEKSPAHIWWLWGLRQVLASHPDVKGRPACGYATSHTARYEQSATSARGIKRLRDVGNLVRRRVTGMQKKPKMNPTVVKLPRLGPADYNEDNHVARSLAEKTRELRLHALKTAPEAFASSYEGESMRDLTHTLERLRTPQAVHFFAIDRAVEPWTQDSHDTFFAELLSANFVGSIVLVGPMAGAEATAKKDPLWAGGGNRESRKGSDMANEPLHYVLNGTFVDPKARRTGIGRALIEAALATGQQQAFNEGVGFRCTVLVDSDNLSAKNLYEKAGFSASGTESYVQHPRSRVRGEVKAVERIAIQLELIRRPFFDKSSLSSSSRVE